jgi:hypothetical protein
LFYSTRNGHILLEKHGCPLFGLLARERSENVNSRCGSQRDRGVIVARLRN